MQKMPIHTLNIIILLMGILTACSNQQEGSREKQIVTDEPLREIPATAYSDDTGLNILGKIYTGSVDKSVHSVSFEKVMEETTGIYLQGGYVLGFGSGAISIEGVKIDTIDLDNAVAYPGFVDAHAHLSGIGAREMTLNLAGTKSIADLQHRLQRIADTRPKAEVITGRGWIETNWPERRFPNRDDLDQVAPDNPVLLRRADGHAMVINSMAISKIGLTDDTLDPQGGRIERDQNGRATGMLIDNAMQLAQPLISEPSRAELKAMLQKGAEVYASRGWTGVHNMSVSALEAELLAELETEGKLPIRVYNSVTPEALDGLIETGIWDIHDGKVTTRAVKFYADGALGSRGAALILPYTDRPETNGLMLLQAEEAKAAYTKALKAGIQVTTHAIGDRGNKFVLDWYEEVLADFEHNPRWRIEHAQILDPVDIPRFAELGIIASMQPSHAISDLHFAPDRLGQRRLEGAYAWQSLLDSGALLVGGSDAPVEKGDPIEEFYAATMRKDLTGFSNEDWHREQRMSRIQAFNAFTRNPAVASFQEDQLGYLALGTKADLTILSGDIFTMPLEDIPKVKVIMTIVDGKIVYDGRSKP